LLLFIPIKLGVLSAVVVGPGNSYNLKAALISSNVLATENSPKAIVYMVLSINALMLRHLLPLEREETQALAYPMTLYNGLCRICREN
jgi:hypothetical protein